MKNNGFKKIMKFLLVTFCVLFTIIYVGFQLKTDSESEISNNMITYNEFWDMVEDGKVDTLYYVAGAKTLKFSDTQNVEYEIPNPSYAEFIKDLLEAGVNVEKVSSGSAGSIISKCLPFVFMIIVLVVLSRVFQDGVGGFKEKDLVQTSNVKFSDVIGHDEILDDIKFISKLIKNRENEIGAEVPKGILLNGSPGCGKTLLAKAIAGESDCKFIYVDASSLIEKYVGVGAKRVRDAFKIARKNSPCVVFIDEIDAVGSSRNNSGRSSESDQTINALLQEMDGMKGRGDGIFIIAATNRAEVLDEALVRSGRFDRQINITPPKNSEIRTQLFEHFLQDKKIAADLDLLTVAKQIPGATGADIAAICNEASMIALQKELSEITQDCLYEAVDKKIFKGNRSKSGVNICDKQIVAYHEAGHAIMTYLTGQPLSRATIIGTTSGVGGAVFGGDSESCFLKKSELEAQIQIAMAGRISEAIKFHDITTGACNDIEQATDMLKAYVSKYSFSSDVGFVNIERLSSNNDINERVQELSIKLYNDTADVLSRNYDLVEILAQALLERETMSGTEIMALFE